MIPSNFNDSASNFGNAAMQAANIPWDTPVQVRLGAEGPGENGAHIEVSNETGFHRTIPIEDGRLAECRQSGPSARALSQQLVDDLAKEIKAAVGEATGS
ncbi:MAG: hypothetical protein ACTH2M_00075 [Microbacteriaceae bacterium]